MSFKMWLEDKRRTVKPILNPAAGNNVPVVAHDPPEGVPINLNVSHTFHVAAHRGSQVDVDDHHDAFFVPRVDV